MSDCIKERLFKCVARCQICGEVLNVAEHVPESEQTGVSISAPFVAICNVRSHNTLSDCNIGVKLEWIEEVKPCT